MKKLIFLLLGLILVSPLFARNYGDPNSEEYRYKVTCRVLNVRDKPGSDGRVLFTMREGDYVYGYAAAGNPSWLRVAGNEWYISSDYITREINPYYNQAPDNTEVDAGVVLRRQRAIRWCLLGQCIVVFIVLMGYLGRRIWNMLVGSVEGKNGLKQKFYYGFGSYGAILSFVGLIVGSIFLGVALLLTIGGCVWLLLAAIWLILKILVIAGYIALIGGILTLLFGEKGVGCLTIIVGGLIVGLRDWLHHIGEIALDAGFSFMRSLYIFDFVRDLVVIYWQPVVIVTAIPLIIFLLFVVVNFIISAIFMLAEYVVTKWYNVKNPCPICQHASEPAIYMSNGIDLPTKLRPGKYGIFHIEHPDTGEKMPTMLFNGKDSLQRRCHHCGSVISAKMGTEKHIVLAGVAESGKTTLVYRMIAELFRKYNGRIDFTDEIDYNMREDIKNVVEYRRIKEFPNKTAVGVMRSIQLLVKRNTMDYRIFINDAGGELYDMAAVNSEAAKEIAQFVRNAETVLFLIDPMTIDFGGLEVSDRFGKWLKQHENKNIQKVDISDAFKRMQQLFERQLSKKRIQKIHMNIVFVKSDLNYLPNMAQNDEQALKEFINADMGLQHLLSDIEASFNPQLTHFVSFSAVKSIEEESNATKLTDMILTQLNIAD